MDEVRRLAYLSAMGIDCYVRREFQPLAPIPDADQLPDSVKQESVVADEVITVSKLKTRLTETLEAQPEPQSDVQLQPEPIETPPLLAQEPALETGGEQLRFSLQFYRISEKFIVINEVPYFGLSRTEKEVNTLLGAILRALGQEVTDLANAARFNWPLSADDDASGLRAPEAYQALQGFLGKRLDANFYDVIVVFGSQCEDLFASSGVGQLLAESSNRVIFTHSLDALLKVPVLKRSVWEAIRVVPKLLK